MFYFFQERLLFDPNSVPTGYCREKWERGPSVDTPLTVPGGSIHVQLFQADERRKVVFYLHGNKGNLELCRWEIEPFIRAGYDVCMMDYRGYGKSRGPLSETALLGDAQVVYKYIKDKYDEDDIIVWGRSFGSGIAAHVASVNRPKKLVLETPYYSLPDCVRHRHWYIPAFLFRYRLPTCDYLGYVECPVHLIHGTDDEKIYYGSSVKLERHCSDVGKKDVYLEEIGNGKHNMRPPADPKTVSIRFMKALSEILHTDSDKS